MSLRAVAFVPHPEAGASGRYRVYQMVAPLRAQGIEMEVRPLLDEAGFDRLYRPGGAPAKAIDLARGMRRRWGAIAEASRYDVALVHRELWPLRAGAALRRLARAQPRFVFDFDDAVFMPNVSDANRAFGWLKSADQAVILTQRAARVAAGNAWLAEWAAARRGGDAGVSVVPTCVDTEVWRPAPERPGPVRIVWTGTHSTARYLAPMCDIWPRIVQRHPEAELHVMGARIEIPGGRVFHHAWSGSGELELVRGAHIGLSPLEDDAWARGKCGLKLLLYMACGLAAIAAPVGVHLEIVEPERNGLLADASAIETALSRLIADRALRESLAARARETVEARYSVAAVAPRLADVLRAAAGVSP